MKTLNALMLTGFVAVATAAPAEAAWNQRGNIRNEIQRDRDELRDSRQEYLKDRRDYLEERREYLNDLRSGAGPRELARERREMREAAAELRDSRREYLNDRRELERDMAQYNWRYGDRDRHPYGGWGGRDDRYNDRYGYRRYDDRRDYNWSWWNPGSWWSWR